MIKLPPLPTRQSNKNRVIYFLRYKSGKEGTISGTVNQIAQYIVDNNRNSNNDRIVDFGKQES